MLRGPSSCLTTVPSASAASLGSGRHVEYAWVGCGFPEEKDRWSCWLCVCWTQLLRPQILLQGGGGGAGAGAG